MEKFIMDKKTYKILVFLKRKKIASIDIKYQNV